MGALLARFRGADPDPNQHPPPREHPPGVNPREHPEQQPIRENPPNPNPVDDTAAPHLSLRLQGPRNSPDTAAGVGKFSQTYPSPVKPDPKPAGKFRYLPEDYAKPTIPISGNTLADATAATVKDIFTTGVLGRRRAVDNHLKEFKRSLGKDTDAQLPACFVSWKNGLFHEWEKVPEGGPFHVEYSASESDDVHMLTAIHANRHRQYLTPELIATGQHMNSLLEACHDFQLNKDDMKKTIREQNLQLMRVDVRSKTLDSIQSELQSLPAEIDQFGKEIDTLIKDIDAAVVSYGQTQKGSHPSITGMKQIRFRIAAT